jgi:hypothetical protein
VTYRDRFILRTLTPYVLVALIATACTLFPAKTFNEKYATGVSTATAALNTTDQLLRAGKLSAKDAKNVEKQIDNVKEALDLARETYATDETTGGNKLASALTALQGVSTYLTQQQRK